MENTTYNQKNPHSIGANKEARTAGLHAKEGRELKVRKESIAKILNAWEGIMSNAPVTIFSSIFATSFIVDIMVSWEMYRDLIGYVFDDQPFWAILLVGLVINGIALKVSHYLGKTKSRALFDLEVWNYIHLRHGGDYDPELAERAIEKECRRDFISFLFWSLILVGTVASISWQRSFLLSAAGNQTADYNSFQKILPVILIIVEVFTGVFLFYVLKYAGKKINFSRIKKAFEFHLRKCGEHDQIAGRLYERAISQGEKFDIQKDLKDSIFRLKFRHISENYLDECQFSQARFEIQINGRTQVPNMRVVGSLPDGSFTDASFTDELGKASLHWKIFYPAIEKIWVNGIEILGPFSKDTEHLIRLGLPQSGNSLLLESGG